MAGATPLRVERLRLLGAESGAGVDAEEWDAFVRRSPDATFFHLAAWREVLERTFGFRPHFLAARRDGDVVGVLPICELRPAWGSPRLLSLPMAVEAGISAADAEARTALETAAIALQGEIAAGSIELRDSGATDDFHTVRGVYCRFRRDLSGGEEENLARVPRKRRRMIRIGQTTGLRVRLDAGLDVFYDLFARSQRRLGTPLLPRAYFERLLTHFADDSLLLTVWRGDTPVAGVLSFLFRDSILPYYAGSHEDYLALGSNDFMYWELMQLARERGLRTFDFGRSRSGSGAFNYKRHWGCEPLPVSYRVRGVDLEVPRRPTVDDPRIRLLRRGWRLLPLPLTKTIGPFFARRFAPYFT